MVDRGYLALFIDFAVNHRCNIEDGWCAVKKVLTVVIGLVIGMTVLAGYLFQALLGPVLALVVDWGILLVGLTGLLGIGYLLQMHIVKLIRRKKGAFFSVVVLLSFVVTLAAGFLLPDQNMFFNNLILNVQIPVEASLLAILAVTLIYTSLHLIRTRGWTPMSVGFLISAVVTLILDLGYFQVGQGTFAAGLVTFLRQLPLVGARGILLGMALGGLIVGLRILLTIDRPYGEG